jgi:signal transduction histidine kinase
MGRNPVAIIEAKGGAREFDCVFLKGIDQARFEEHRYNLKYSPVGTVVCKGRGFHEEGVSAENPGACARLLKLVPFKALIGMPIPTFGMVRHGLFVFGGRASFRNDEEEFIESMTERLSLALERAEFTKRMAHQHTLYSLGNLFAGMSHEIANHMNNVRNALESLKFALTQQGGNGNQAGDPMEMLDKLSGAVDNVGNVVTMFLGLTKSARSLKTEDILTSMAQVTDLMQMEARRLNVKLHYETPPAAAALCAYPRVVLRQALFNLVLNALQHTNTADGAKREVLLTGDYDLSRPRPVLLRVTDTGLGIHKDWWERIFHPYFTSRSDGSGLGLYIAQTLLEQVGAKIGVERSVLFDKTTILIELPDARERKGR